MGRVYISAPKTEDPSVYRGLFQKRQAGWLRKCFFKYSTEVTVVLEIQENSKVIASELP